ncbi:MAG TPA: O-antigen ligase family protein [Candidatus Goldiibacteriota bacterium]|nr:O-antigen ligase family protein [Candidatus Goldiibacteriota bacterium]
MNQITMEYKVAWKKPLFLINLLILFVFIISLIAFYQPFFDPFGPAQLMVIRIFIPLIVLLCLITNVKNRQIALKTNPLLIPFAIYILISLISVLFAFNKEISFKYFIELLLLILGSYFIYSLTDKKFIEKLIVVILIVHTLISCYGIFQHFDMDFFKWNTNFSGRPMGTIGNPDFFAGQLLFPLFLLLSFIFFGRKNRILIVAAFLTSFLAFFYTKVAGAAIGFFCGIAVFFVIFIFLKFDFIKKIFKNKIVFFIVIFSIIFVSVLFFKPCYNKINNVFIEKQRSIAHRFLMWKASLLIVRESPVFGKGIGNYRIYYPYYQAKLLNNPENKKYDYVVTWMPHQNYLLIASET